MCNQLAGIGIRDMETRLKIAIFALHTEAEGESGCVILHNLVPLLSFHYVMPLSQLFIQDCCFPISTSFQTTYN